NYGDFELLTGTLLFNGSFFNAGTVALSAGTLACNNAFVNSGTVTLSAGATNLLSGGGLSSGTFNVPPGSALEIAANAFTLNPGAQLVGAGPYDIDVNGTLLVNADVSVQHLEMTGTISGTGTVAIAQNLNWRGGSMVSSGRTLISHGAILEM